MSSEKRKPKILHFSPVRKPAKIVKLHCISLNALKLNDFDFTYSFFDDNIDLCSSEILREFKNCNENTLIFKDKDLKLISDYRGKKRWTIELYDRITTIKDFIIEYFVLSEYDYLFLSDSDLLIHPETIINLYSHKKKFISEVFWTNFEGRPTYFPNAWYSGNNGFKNKDQLIEIRDKSIIEVDYTGACTLLSREILESNVRFKKIPNLSNNFLGEDKHFCIRAHVNNYKIFLNTESPAFHIYNNSLIDKGQLFIESGFDNKFLYKDWLDDTWEKCLDDYFTNSKLSRISYSKRIFNYFFQL
jgi:hypothetical protein